MPDYEELRLRVTLQDEASAALSRLRSELSQLGSGAQAQGFERMRTQNVQLTQILRPVAQGSLSVRQSMNLMAGQFAVAGAAVTALGYAFYNQIQRLKSFSSEITQLTAQARALGINAEDFEHIKEQMMGMGISGQKAEAFITNFAKSMADLLREGSKIERTLMEGAFRSDPAAMQAWLQQMTGMARVGDIRGAMNRFRTGIKEIWANELAASGGSELLAADMVSYVLAAFNLDEVTLNQILNDFTELSDAARNHIKERHAAAKAYEQEYNRLAGHMRGFWSSMNQELVKAFTEMFEQVGASRETFQEWGTWVGGLLGDDVRQITAVVQQITRAIDWINSLKDKTAADLVADLAKSVTAAPEFRGAGGQPATSGGDWWQGRVEAFKGVASNFRRGIDQLVTGQDLTPTDYDAVIQEMIGNTDVVETQTNQMRDLADEIRELTDQLQGTGGGAAGAEARAHGGSVYSGRQYMVGERGPELFMKRQGGGPVEGGVGYVVGEQGPETFVPTQSGVIIPNSAQMGGISGALSKGLGGILSGIKGSGELGGQAADLAQWGLYGGASALGFLHPGLENIGQIVDAAMRGAGGAPIGGLGHQLGVASVPGFGILEAMKRDSEQGHPVRTQLRSLLGIEDPGEPAPWQRLGGGGEGQSREPDLMINMSNGGDTSSLFAGSMNLLSVGGGINIFGGGGEAMEAAAARTEADRATIDRGMGGEISSRVEGEGTVNIDVGDGGAARRTRWNNLFKRTPIQRHTQMEPAESGPETTGSAVSAAIAG